MNKIFILDITEELHKLNEILKSSDYETITFSNIQDLLYYIPVHKPQLIIVDDISKKNLKKIIRSYFFIPVIVYGSSIREKTYSNYIKKGYIKYISNNLEQENILSIIKETFFKGLAKPYLWDKELKINSSILNLRKIKNIILVILLCGLILVSYIIAKNNIFDKQNFAKLIKTYYLPYSNPTGLTVVGNELWVCDWNTQNIYIHSKDKNLNMIKIFSVPYMRFSCISQKDEFLWAYDPWNNKICKLKVNNQISLISSYDVSGVNITGMCFDGSYLWLIDINNKKISKYIPEEKLIFTESFPCPDSNISGIFIDDNKIIWTVDSNKIYKHKNDKNLTVESIFELSDEETSRHKISSIAVDSDSIWICIEKLQKIIKYPKNIMVSGL